MSCSSFEQTVTNEMKMVFMTPRPHKNIKRLWQTKVSYSEKEPDLYRTYLWWCTYVFPNTHNTHTHTRTIVCARNTNSPRIYTVYTGRLLQLPFNLQLLSVFIRLRCMDDKLPWLHGWSSEGYSPHTLQKYCSCSASSACSSHTTSTTATNEL